MVQINTPDDRWRQAANEAVRFGAWGLAVRACIGAMGAGQSMPVSRVEIIDGLEQPVMPLLHGSSLRPEDVLACLNLNKGRKPTRDGLLLLIEQILPFSENFGSQRGFACLLDIDENKLASWLHEARKRVDPSFTEPRTGLGSGLLREGLVRYHIPYYLTIQTLLHVVGTLVEFPFDHSLGDAVDVSAYEFYPSAMNELAKLVKQNRLEPVADINDCWSVRSLLAALLALAAKAMHNILSHSYPGSLLSLVEELPDAGNAKNDARALLSACIEPTTRGLRHVVEVFSACRGILPDMDLIASWQGRSLEELAWWEANEAQRQILLAQAARLYATSSNLSRCLDVLASGLPNTPDWLLAVESIYEKWGPTHYHSSVGGQDPRLLLRTAIRCRWGGQWEKARACLQQARAQMGVANPWSSSWRRGDLMAQLAEYEMDVIGKGVQTA